MRNTKKEVILLREYWSNSIQSFIKELSPYILNMNTFPLINTSLVYQENYESPKKNGLSSSSNGDNTKNHD